MSTRAETARNLVLDAIRQGKEDSVREWADEDYNIEAYQFADGSIFARVDTSWTAFETLDELVTDIASLIGDEDDHRAKLVAHGFK